MCRRARFDVYRAVSQQIRGIFARYTLLIQPLSLDEAYLDVTAPLLDRCSATAIAEEIRAAIRVETALTASAGVSYNKFLAKLASDYRKPDGLFVITPSMGPDFVAQLPVAKFHGVGPVTAARMNKLGIYTGLDLRRQTQAFLAAQFGKAGDYFYHLARAEDDRLVVADHPRKSLGAETTFARDLLAWEEVAPALEPVFAKLWAAYSRHRLTARTVTVKIKYANFQQISRSRSSAEPIASRAMIEQFSLDLLQPHFPPASGCAAPRGHLVELRCHNGRGERPDSSRFSELRSQARPARSSSRTSSYVQCQPLERHEKMRTASDDR